MRSWWLAVVLAHGCGPKARPFIVPVDSPQREGLTECGGGLSLIGDWEREKPGDLKARHKVGTVERIPAGVRVGIEGGPSFVISQAASLPPVVAVGDRIEVSIQCEPVGRDVLGCFGYVIANDRLVAFNQRGDATKAWSIVRGPLLERSTHPNYGPTMTYGLAFSTAGASAVSPLRGCAEMITPEGTFRVSGGETEHGDPRAADSADTSSFSVIRIR